MQTGTIPTVSVVMPAYNAEKYLREAIDSILNQTYRDFEFIIINDGSTDQTKDIILSYNDPRIVYLENEKNSGICVTLNKGLDVARGKYIARMDSDDISLPERLAVQVKYMDEHPEIGVSGSDIYIFGEGVNPYVFTQLYTPEECSAGLLFNPCFAHPSVIIRKDLINKYHLRYKDEFRGLEDYELWWQINKYSKLNNIAQPLLKYRHHKGQETQNVTPKVRNKLVSFAKSRFVDLKIPISNKELDLWTAYSFNDFTLFDDKAIKQFISLLKRIIQDYPNKTSRITNALRLTFAKSITYILYNSKEYIERRQKYYNHSLAVGIFSLVWFSKVTYHNLLK